jgi:hypothetical protein
LRRSWQVALMNRAFYRSFLEGMLTAQTSPG